MPVSVHLGAQAEQHNFKPAAEIPLTGRTITRHPSKHYLADTDFTTPLQFEINTNNSMYFLRSAMLRLPVRAKFTTFAEQPIDRNMLSSMALRNRPSLAFDQNPCERYAHGPYPRASGLHRAARSRGFDVRHEPAQRG